MNVQEFLREFVKKVCQEVVPHQLLKHYWALVVRVSDIVMGMNEYTRGMQWAFQR